MSKMQRNKGARLEREVVNLFKAYGFNAKRTGEWHKDDIEVKEIGTVEVKGRKNGFCSLYTFLAHNKAVVHRADNKPWLVTFYFKDFLDREGTLERSNSTIANDISEEEE